MKLVSIYSVALSLILFSGAIVFNRCTDGHSSSLSLPATVDFNFHVRPILVQKCYLCHGPDSSSREAELRLDTFEGATAQREGGDAAVVPGRPGRSEMIRRIRHHDPNEMMPPPESNLTLNEREMALLEKWIEQGAEWKSHWAFIPPILPPVPTVSLPEAVANEVDAFVLSKLEEKRLEPAPRATKNALIRRLSYLLTGLPPHTSAIEKFLADTSPTAYEKLVDYYLNSPHFGERWARHWMDVVRYAETKGHEFDYPVIGAWHYRDYLIRAFNEDLPYDQLVREHLAGDLLNKPRRDKKTGREESALATIFYTMTEGKHSPVSLTQDESERIDNMIDVTTKTFQGLTVACAKCHDHKFDPIPTTDYYALYGVMKSSRFSVQSTHAFAETEAGGEETQKLERAIRKKLADEWNPAAGRSKSTISPEEETKETHQYTMIGDFRGQGLDSWRSDGEAFGHRTTLGNPVFNASGTRLIALSEGKASSRQSGTGVLGALRSPDFIIEKDFIGVRASGENARIRIIIDNFQLIQDPIYGELEIRVEQPEWRNYTVDVSPWKGHKAYIEILPGYYERHHYQLPSAACIEIEYALAFNKTWPSLPESANLAPVDLPQAIQAWSDYQSTPQQVRLINRALRDGTLPHQHPEVTKLHRQATVNQTADTNYFMGITEGYAHNNPVFVRGDYQNLSEQTVPRRFLSVLDVGDSVFHASGSGRLELAEAMLHPDNPLTARVMVNRIWHHLFGRGIVETVDNFGLQGKLPTHPELLDFLAIKFREDGWSMKKMIRYLVLSYTFQRAVVIDTATGDPENLWLARFPLRRLEAEAIRDGLLAVAGSLDSTQYGPPVPVHLTEFMQGRGRPSVSGPLDGGGRRSIYLEVRRNFLSPMMLAFDRPIPFTTFGKRNTTNVPAQSLFLMNDPLVAEQARLMAQRALSRSGQGVESNIQWIYQRAFARAPRKEEVDRARAFLQQQAPTYEADATQPGYPEAAWADYCHAIFNTKEFIYLL